MGIDPKKQRETAAFLLMGLEQAVREKGTALTPLMAKSFREARKEFNKMIPKPLRSHAIARARELTNEMTDQLAEHIKKDLADK